MQFVAERPEIESHGKRPTNSQGLQVGCSDTIMNVQWHSKLLHTKYFVVSVIMAGVIVVIVVVGVVVVVAQ